MYNACSNHEERYFRKNPDNKDEKLKERLAKTRHFLY